jgi:two-component system chemotaxis response regulator CheY
VSKRVLVAGEAPVLRALLAGILERRGFEVAGHAGGATETIARYGELRPDLVVLDLALSGSEGTAPVRALIAAFPDARVIVCAARTQAALANEAVAAGARAYVAKPYLPDALVETLDAVLAAPP